MKNTIEPIKIGYLINKDYSIQIPLNEGINEINSQIFSDNPKFNFLENLNLVLFKINFQTNDRAYLRSYEQFPLHLRYEEKTNKMEEYFLCKSSIVTITTSHNLQIKILNSKISFGTFNFVKNSEIVFNCVKKNNEKLSDKESKLEIIDLCTPFSESFNTSSTIIQNYNDENSFSIEQRKSEINLRFKNLIADANEEIIYTSSHSDSGDKLAEISFENSGHMELEENKLGDCSSDSYIFNKTLEGDNIEHREHIGCISPFAMNNYDIIVIPKILLSNFNEILVESGSNNLNANSRNLIKQTEIKLENKNDPKVKSSYALRNKEKAQSQLKLANHSLPISTVLEKDSLKALETPTLLRKRRRNAEHETNIHNITQADTEAHATNLCMICLDAIKDPSKLNSCGHIFCKECIDKWTDVSNTCPLCKKQFKKIIYFKNNYKVLKERKVRKKTFKIEDNEEDSDAWIDHCLDHCMVCKKTNDVYLMLVCDKCHYNVCHTYCAGLDKIPQEDWLCMDCMNSPRGKSQIQTRQGKKIKN